MTKQQVTPLLKSVEWYATPGSVAYVTFPAALGWYVAGIH